jgi:hypothetical protein
MKVYHGSNQEVAQIDLAKCNPFKDFGRGFYVTSIHQQAVEWAKKVAHRRGGTPTLNVFDFDDSALQTLKCKEFSEPTAEWGEFIINNRNRDFKDFSNELSNFDNKYDIVHGLVANDDIATTLETFILGLLPLSELGKVLQYRKLNDQYSFHTERALEYLRFLGSERV